MVDHPFWFLLTLCVLGWYFLVMVYVAFKGVGDIRTMLSRVKEDREE
jgi:hypothetical protein